MARVAIPHVVLHILSHSWPEVHSCYKLRCPETARVAGCGVIVILAEQVEVEVIRGGDV